MSGLPRKHRRPTPFFPRPNRGELAYSLVAKYHLMSGNVSAHATLRRLLGRSSPTIGTILPTRLDAFVERVPLFDASTFLSAHTAFPYFSAFMSRRRSESLSARMVRSRKAGGSAHPSGPFRIQPRRGFLNYCSKCVSEDIERDGMPMWRTEHQPLGVAACARHHLPLRSEWIGARSRAKVALVLPPEASGSTEVEVRDVRIALATWTADVLQLPTGTLDSTRMVRVLSIGLRQAGYLSPDGVLSGDELQSDLDRCLRTLPSMPDHWRFDGIGSGAATLVARTLAAGECVARPETYLLVLQCLFHNLGQALQALEASQSSGALWSGDHDSRKNKRPSKQVVGANEVSLRRNGQPRAIAAIRARHPPVNATVFAREHSVTVQTAIKHASRQGMIVHRRPKKLTKETRSEINRKLRDGAKPDALAAAYELSLSTIHRVLYENLGVWRVRERRTRHQTRTQHREQVSTYLRHRYRLKDGGNVRLACPAAYSWLRRHDDAWLSTQLKAHPSPRGVAASRVDWASRDKEWAAHIHRLCERRPLSRKPPIRRSRTYLLGEIGLQSLEPLRSGKLPRTAAALERFAESSLQFKEARVKWAIVDIQRTRKPLLAWQVRRHANVRVNMSLVSRLLKGRVGGVGARAH